MGCQMTLPGATWDVEQCGAGLPADTPFCSIAGTVSFIAPAILPLAVG